MCASCVRRPRTPCAWLRQSAPALACCQPRCCCCCACAPADGCDVAGACLLGPGCECACVRVALGHGLVCDLRVPDRVAASCVAARVGAPPPAAAAVLHAPPLLQSAIHCIGRALQPPPLVASHNAHHGCVSLVCAASWFVFTMHPLPRRARGRAAMLLAPSEPAGALSGIPLFVHRLCLLLAYALCIAGVQRTCCCCARGRTHHLHTSPARPVPALDGLSARM